MDHEDIVNQLVPVVIGQSNRGACGRRHHSSSQS